MSFFDISVHNVVISRKTVKLAMNTIGDSCALKSGWRSEFSDISGHTVVKSRKMVK